MPTQSARPVRPAQQAGFFDAFTMSSRLRSGFGAQCHGAEVDDI